MICFCPSWKSNKNITNDFINKMSNFCRLCEIIKVTIYTIQVQISVPDPIINKFLGLPYLEQKQEEKPFLFCDFFMTLSLKNDVPSKSKKKKIGRKKLFFCLLSWRSLTERAGYGSADPDPHQHVKDQEHW
jgi:hypothetical protein